MSWARGSWFGAMLVAGWWVLAAGLSGAAQPLELGASSAVLVDANTGTVLFQKDMRARRPVASTTKVMTALVALETADLRDLATVSERATQVRYPGLGFQAGERVSLDDLLAALLLKSSNAAAVVIAEHVAGSVEAFAERMNERARSLGARDTHFVNPHGLHHPDHYSSAYDLALITRAALEYPRFRQLVAQRQAAIDRPDMGERVVVENHNKLLARAPFVDGVKTGYVKESGQCLIASGTRDGWQLVAVVLNSPDPYAESLALLDHGFGAFRQRLFARRGDAVGRARVRFGSMGSVPAVCQRTVSQVLGPGLPPAGRLEVTMGRASAPVEAGQEVGQAKLVVAGRVVASAPLVAAQQVPRSRLVVALGWVARLVAVLALVAIGIRTGAKVVKGRRRRRGRLAAQSGSPGEIGPGPG